MTTEDVLLNLSPRLFEAYDAKKVQLGVLGDSDERLHLQANIESKPADDAAERRSRPVETAFTGLTTKRPFDS